MVDLSEIFKTNSMNNSVGTSRNGKIDKNAFFYHVVQQTDNRAKLFNADISRHRDGLFKSECSINNVLPIANVIMPTHTHDIVLASNFEAVRKVLRCTNAGTAQFLRNRWKANNWTINSKVFSTRPGYIAVKTRKQLFVLIKYLYDNPAYLRQINEPVPYSCFDSWEKNNFKPYDKTILEKIFDLEITVILDKCKNLTRNQYNALADDLFGSDSDELSEKLFIRRT